ncbi:uncharacterized protein J3D65DRAFT_462397 [Phyllosticta citribraziliensis]|uniref:Rhodopsin domain-containing protein n=1 Tax=Phyllosticta citribraziliensis TaxID=989973 RepID=A0ABR1LFB0_9PEZI
MAPIDGSAATTSSAPSFDKGWPTSAASVVGTTVPVTAVMLMFVFTRIYTSVFLTRMFGWQDTLVFLSGLMTVGNTVVTCFGVRYGLAHHVGSIKMSDMEKGLKCVYASLLLFPPIVACTKIATCLGYRRLFPGNANRWFCIALIVYCLMWGIAAFFGQTFVCTPVKLFWTKPFDEDRNCQDVRALVQATAALNSLGDLLVYLWPANFLFKLRVPLKHKFGLLTLFSVGCCVIAASICRMIYIPRGLAPTTEILYNAGDLLLIASIEENVGIICACLPLTKVFLARLFPRFMIGSSNITTQPGTLSHMPPTFPCSQSYSPSLTGLTGTTATPGGTIHTTELSPKSSSTKSRKPSLPESHRRPSLPISKPLEHRQFDVPIIAEPKPAMTKSKTQYSSTTPHSSGPQDTPSRLPVSRPITPTIAPSPTLYSSPESGNRFAYRDPNDMERRLLAEGLGLESPRRSLLFPSSTVKTQAAQTPQNPSLSRVEHTGHDDGVSQIDHLTPPSMAGNHMPRKLSPSLKSPPPQHYSPGRRNLGGGGGGGPDVPSSNKMDSGGLAPIPIRKLSTSASPPSPSSKLSPKWSPRLTQKQPPTDPLAVQKGILAPLGMAGDDGSNVSLSGAWFANSKTEGSVGTLSRENSSSTRGTIEAVEAMIGADCGREILPRSMAVRS